MTRKQLIEFLELSIHGKDTIYGSLVNVRNCIDSLADALIKEGFVKVKEPKSFWICDYHKLYSEDKNIKCAVCTNACKIIHVREVVEK
jgi:hypothetical protein